MVKMVKSAGSEMVMRQFCMSVRDSSMRVMQTSANQVQKFFPDKTIHAVP